MSMQVFQPRLFTKRDICPIARLSFLKGRFSAIFRDFPNYEAFHGLFEEGSDGTAKTHPTKKRGSKGGAASFESVELRGYSSRSSAAKARAFRSCFRSTPGYSLRMFSTR